MELERSYDTDFIESELTDLEDFFSMFERVGTYVAKKKIRTSVEDILSAHQYLLENDLDSAFTMMQEKFFKPLRNILPEQHRFAMIFTSNTSRSRTGRIDLDLKMTDQYEMNILLQYRNNPDSRVSFLTDEKGITWLLVCRLEKSNIYERKLLK